MKTVFPFLLVLTGVFAIVGVLFLIMRGDSFSTKVRAFDWRKAINATLDEPVVEPVMEEAV